MRTYRGRLGQFEQGNTARGHAGKWKRDAPGKGSVDIPPLPPAWTFIEHAESLW
jgi:hypothetical protein